MKRIINIKNYTALPLWQLQGGGNIKSKGNCFYFAQNLEWFYKMYLFYWSIKIL
jgi:hypothetical protein